MIAAVTLLVLALGQTPGDLVRQLGDEEASRREEAATALEALGREAIAALEAGAKSDDPEVRERASEVLRSVRTTIAVGRKLDPERMARVRAAIDDWRSRWKPPNGVVFVQHPNAYDDLLAYPDGEDRPPDPGDVVYLLGILSDPGPCDGEVEGLTRGRYLRVRALQAIRHFPVVDENETRLIAILRDVLPAGDRAEGKSDELYRARLYAEVAQVSQAAVREAIRARTMAALESLVTSEQQAVRLAVAGALTAREDPDTVPLLSRLILDDDDHVQAAAIRSLDERDPTPFEKPLLEALETIEPDGTRFFASVALARCGRREGVDGLFFLLNGGGDEGWAGVAARRLPELVAMPQEVARAGVQASRDWWKANRDRARWDPVRQAFVVE